MPHFRDPAFSASSIIFSRILFGSQGVWGASSGLAQGCSSFVAIPEVCRELGSILWLRKWLSSSSDSTSSSETPVDTKLLISCWWMRQNTYSQDSYSDDLVPSSTPACSWLLFPAWKPYPPCGRYLRSSMRKNKWTHIKDGLKVFNTLIDVSHSLFLRFVVVLLPLQLLFRIILSTSMKHDRNQYIVPKSYPL